HRLRHEKRSSVYAYKQELDAWWELKKHTIEPESPKAASVEIVRAVSWRWAGLVAGALAIAALVIGTGGRSSVVGRRSVASVAVMPFANLTAESADEWFTDGMTETLLTELAKIRTLSVISRTSVMRY